VRHKRARSGVPHPVLPLLDAASCGALMLLSLSHVTAMLHEARPQSHTRLPQALAAVQDLCALALRLLEELQPELVADSRARATAPLPAATVAAACAALCSPLRSLLQGCADCRNQRGSACSADTLSRPLGAAHSVLSSLRRFSTLGKALAAAAVQPPASRTGDDVRANISADGGADGAACATGQTSGKRKCSEQHAARGRRLVGGRLVGGRAGDRRDVGDRRGDAALQSGDVSRKAASAANRVRRGANASLHAAFARLQLRLEELEQTLFEIERAHRVAASPFSSDASDAASRGSVEEQLRQLSHQSTMCKPHARGAIKADQQRGAKLKPIEIVSGSEEWSGTDGEGWSLRSNDGSHSTRGCLSNADDTSEGDDFDDGYSYSSGTSKDSAGVKLGDDSDDCEEWVAKFVKGAAPQFSEDQASHDDDTIETVIVSFSAAK